MLLYRAKLLNISQKSNLPRSFSLFFSKKNAFFKPIVHKTAKKWPLIWDFIHIFNIFVAEKQIPTIKSFAMKVLHSLSALLLLAMTGNAAWAQTVDQNEALTRASRFLGLQNRAPSQGDAAQQLTLAYKSAAGDETYYYVFNHADGGFVIVGGDQAAAEILGYSEEGSFQYDQLPPQMQWWLGQYDKDISHAIRGIKEGTIKLDTNAAQHAPAAKSNVAPLLGAMKWDQILPFNALIPGNEAHPNDNSQIATGCVATAIAQVMKYHNYPAQGIGRKKYINNGVTYEANFGETTYNWAAMTDTYPYNNYTGTASQDAVATLMYHVGVSVSMDYGDLSVGGSGAAVANVATALSTYFGYSKSTQYCDRDNYSDADWENIIYNDLKAGRPIIYGGQDQYSSAGHCFVCDGYRASDNMFHINWGWSGQSDNYFKLTGTGALQPDYSGAGGAGDGAAYSRRQEAIIGLEPDPSNEGNIFMPEPVKYQNNGYTTNSASYTVEFTLENPTSNNISCDICLFIFPEEGGSSITSCYIGEKTVNAHGSLDIKGTYPKANIGKLTTGKDYIHGIYDFTSESYFATDIIHVRAAKNVTATVTEAGWRTLCLPYEAELPTGWEAYEVTGVSGSSLVKNSVTKLEMNKPYLIKAPAGSKTFTGPTTPQGTFENGILTGSTKSTTTYAPKDSYVLQNIGGNVAFYQVQSNNTQKLTQYTAYINPSTTWPARLNFFEDDDTTDISQLEAEEEQTAPTYNLQGQRVSGKKGLVIMNGKINFIK